MTDFGKKLVNGVLAPAGPAPSQIGFGCPKCDDALFLAPDASQADWDAFMAKFLGKHRSCGDLEVLVYLYLGGAND